MTNASTSMPPRLHTCSSIRPHTCSAPSALHTYIHVAIPAARLRSSIPRHSTICGMPPAFHASMPPRLHTCNSIRLHTCNSIRLHTCNFIRLHICTAPSALHTSSTSLFPQLACGVSYIVRTSAACLQRSTRPHVHTSMPPHLHTCNSIRLHTCNSIRLHTSSAPSALHPSIHPRRYTRGSPPELRTFTFEHPRHASSTPHLCTSITPSLRVYTLATPYICTPVARRQRSIPISTSLYRQLASGAPHFHIRISAHLQRAASAPYPHTSASLYPQLASGAPYLSTFMRPCQCTCTSSLEPNTSAPPRHYTCSSPPELNTSTSLHLQLTSRAPRFHMIYQLAV